MSTPQTSSSSRHAQLIYLDHAASTPVMDEVGEAMRDAQRFCFGNASGAHAQARLAREAVKDARAQVASLFGCGASEVVFTSGATEGLNLALRGLAANHPDNHMITCETEHRAVLDTLSALTQRGLGVSYVSPDEQGRFPLDALDEQHRPDTRAVCVMWVNNETGVCHPIDEITEWCRAQGIWMICDATQAVGKLDVRGLYHRPDALVCSAHKCGGPLGVGALVATRRFQAELQAQLTGGGQQKGLRSGTLNVPGIVGFGVAAKHAEESIATSVTRMSALRERWEDGLLARFPGAVVHGVGAQRAPHISCVSIPGVDAQALLARCKQVCLSHGSACSALHIDPSHVLMAMGVEEARALEAIRMSVGVGTTAGELAGGLAEVVSHAEILRSVEW